MSNIFLYAAYRAMRQRRRPGSAPKFVSQTANQSLKLGDTLRLTAEFSGDPVPTLELKKDGVVLPTNNGVYIKENVTAEDAGTYVWRATNTGGSIAGPPIAVAVQTIFEVGEIYRNEQPKVADFELFGGAAFSDNNGMLQLSGGGYYDTSSGAFIGDFEDADENMTYGMEVKASSKDFSIAIGKPSTNSWSKVNSYVNLFMGDGTLGINGLKTAPQKLNIALNDVVQIVYKSSPGTITAFCKNITQDKEVSFEATVDFYDKTLLQANTGRPAIFAGGATVLVQKVWVSRQSHVGIKGKVSGDSKSYGLGALSALQRYWAQAATNLNLQIESFAGNGDRTIEQRKTVQTIISQSPDFVVMFIGRNNNETPEGQAAFQPDYLFMRNSYVDAGIKVIHILPAPEGAYTQDNVKNYIKNTFPGDPMVDPSIGWNNAWVYDNVHFNQAGHDHVAGLLTAKLQEVLGL